jgi:Ca2+-binding EF-hand superfamily protein
MIDTNGDGEISKKEADAAADKMEEEDDVQLKALVTDPSKDQWEELGKALWDATEGDNTLEKGELIDIVGAWATKHGFKMPEGWKDYVGKVFDYVDKNSDGHVTRDEMKAAFEKEEEGKDEMDVQLKSKLKSATQLRDPSEDQWNELGKAIYDATSGDETLELGELIGLVKKWATKHGFADKLPKGWKGEVKKVFDYVDANHDGHVTRDELEGAMKAHDEEDVQLAAKVATGLKLEDPSKEQWEELGKAIWDATSGDETLEKPELIAMVGAWATKHEFKMPKGWKDYVGKVFDYVDANSDGHVTRDELEAAMKKHK